MLILFTLPAILGQTASVLTMVADTSIVGQYLGATGIAGLTATVPVQLFQVALAYLVGMGASVLVSRALGSHDTQAGEESIAAGLVLSVLLGVVLWLVTQAFGKELVYFFGAEGSSVPIALSYLKGISWGFPFVLVALCCNWLLRALGKPILAMSNLLLGAILKVFFTPLFIEVLHMRPVFGAAMATVATQIGMFLYAFGCLVLVRVRLRVRLHTLLTCKWHTMYQISKVGIAGFFRMASDAAIAAWFTLLLGGISSVEELAVLGLVVRMTSIFRILPIAIMQGMLPLVAYAQGAKEYQRAARFHIIAQRWAFYVNSMACIFCIMAPTVLVLFFTHDQAVQDVSRQVLPVVFSCFFVTGAQMLGAAYFQARGWLKLSYITTLARFACAVPLATLLVGRLGVQGLWITYPIMDTMVFLITMGCAVAGSYTHRKEHPLQEQPLNT